VHGPKHRFDAPAALLSPLPQVGAVAPGPEQPGALRGTPCGPARRRSPQGCCRRTKILWRGVTECLLFCTLWTRRSPPISLPPNGGRGRGPKESTRLGFLAFRVSYTTRWEIQFIFTAFSCPVVGPVRRADWRQARPGGRGAKNLRNSDGNGVMAEHRWSYSPQ
jgi:hypothetical protein